MVKPAEDERLTFLQSVFCGGIAGVLSRTVTSPLEVVKVLSQVGTPETRFGFLRTFNRIYRSEGLKAFWKGNGISCLRLVPYSAIQMAAFHNLVVSDSTFSMLNVPMITCSKETVGKDIGHGRCRTSYLGPLPLLFPRIPPLPSTQLILVFAAQQVMIFDICDLEQGTHFKWVL